MIFAQTHSSFLDSTLFGAIIGAAFAIIAVFLGQELQRRHQEKKEIKNYIAILKSASNELLFYHGKLTQLHSEVGAIIGDLQNLKVRDIIHPSYDLYPSYLEYLKSAISGYSRNPEIIQQIAHCHFELSHIMNRLNLSRSELDMNMIRSSSTYRMTALKNTQGFQNLIRAGIDSFRQAETILKKEISDSDSELRNYDYLHAPFSQA
jgi:hypothetical protein